MKRLAKLALFTMALIYVAACSDTSKPAEPDAAGPDCVSNGGADCFALPTAGVKDKDGAAPDFSCGTVAIETGTAEIALSGTIEDFQSGDPVDDVLLEAFTAFDFGDVFASVTSDTNGNFAVSLPVGAKSRMHFRTSKPEAALDTYALNINIDTSAATITNFNRGSVSILTANALPAFIGVTRSAGLGVVAGVANDCAGKTLENVIATVSSSSSVGNVAPTFLPGPQVYYFSNGSTQLPVRRTTRNVSNPNGLFVLIEMPPTAPGQTVFLQVWGFLTDADAAQGMAGLKLLGELETPVVGDAVISVDMAANQGPQ